MQHNSTDIEAISPDVLNVELEASAMDCDTIAVLRVHKLDPRAVLPVSGSASSAGSCGGEGGSWRRCPRRGEVREE